MHPAVQNMVDGLTGGGKVVPYEAAKEIVNTEIDKPAALSSVWRECSVGQVFAVSEANRERLDAIERAGEGLVWAVEIDPGRGTTGAVHIRKDSVLGDTMQAVSVGTNSLVYGENLTVLDDGCLVIWTETAEGGDFIVLAGANNDEFRRKQELSDVIQVLPVTEAGLPMILPTRVESVLHALGAIAHAPNGTNAIGQAQLA